MRNLEEIKKIINEHKPILDELGIIWSTEGHFLKKPYRNISNEASS